MEKHLCLLYIFCKEVFHASSKTLFSVQYQKYLLDFNLERKNMLSWLNEIQSELFLGQYHN